MSTRYLSIYTSGDAFTSVSTLSLSITQNPVTVSASSDQHVSAHSLSLTLNHATTVTNLVEIPVSRLSMSLTQRAVSLVINSSVTVPAQSLTLTQHDVYTVFSKNVASLSISTTLNQATLEIESEGDIEVLGEGTYYLEGEGLFGETDVDLERLGSGKYSYSGQGFADYDTGYDSLLGTGDYVLSGDGLIDFQGQIAEEILGSGEYALGVAGDTGLIETVGTEQSHNLLGEGAYSESGEGLIEVSGLLDSKSVKGSGRYLASGWGLFSDVTAVTAGANSTLLGSGLFYGMGDGLLDRTYADDTEYNETLLGSGSYTESGTGLKDTIGYKADDANVTLLGRGTYSLTDFGLMSNTGVADAGTDVTLLGTGLFISSGTGYKDTRSDTDVGITVTQLGYGLYSLSGGYLVDAVTSGNEVELTGSGEFEYGVLPGLMAVGLPRYVELMGEGEYLVAGEGIVDQVQKYQTWVFNGLSFEASLYSNWDFNSYAKLNGKAYGAKNDGIYLLEGDDDNGTDFHPSVMIGPTTMGTAKVKRVRSVKIPGCGAEPTISVTGRRGIYTYNSTVTATNDKAYVGSNAEGNDITLVVEDFAEVGALEITPVVLSRS